MKKILNITTILAILTSVSFASMVPVNKNTDITTENNITKLSNLDKVRLILNEKLPKMLPMYNISYVRESTVNTIINKLKANPNAANEILDDFNTTGMSQNNLEQLKQEILPILQKQNLQKLSQDSRIDSYEPFLNSEESINKISEIIKNSITTNSSYVSGSCSSQCYC